MSIIDFLDSDHHSRIFLEPRVELGKKIELYRNKFGTVSLRFFCVASF